MAESYDSIDANCDGYDGPTTVRFDTYAYHTCIIDSNAALSCSIDSWIMSFYDHGQFVSPAGAWLDVAASYYSTCAVSDAGEISCWGDWDGASLPTGPFERLSISDSMGCAWDSASAISCWNGKIGRAHV